MLPTRLPKQNHIQDPDKVKIQTQTIPSASSSAYLVSSLKVAIARAIDTNWI